MLSFVTPIAYDYRYALRAIASYYDIASEIVLGLDWQRISWSGRPFAFDMDDFRAGLAKLDRDRKITIIEDHFHLHAEPMANECHEHVVLASACKPGNWILHIDSDEYLLNAQEFAAWLKPVPAHLGIEARWVTIYKEIGDDYLVIDSADEWISVGTKSRWQYVASRRADQAQLRSPLVLLHQAYGRTRSELEQKLQHWGHSRDIDAAALLTTWDRATLDNYREYQNFHPIHPPWWPRLARIARQEFGIT